MYHPLLNTPRALTDYKVAGTDSYRLSSRQLFGFGLNAQNMESSALSMVSIEHTHPDWVFVQPDQSGAEALIVAYLAKPGRYRRLFQCGIKPHNYICAHIFAERFNSQKFFGAEPETLVDNPEWSAVVKAIALSAQNGGREYDLSKRVMHGWSYMMGANTFLSNLLVETDGELAMTKEEAEIFLSTPAKLFPEVVEWQQEVYIEAVTKRVLYNLLGYPLTCMKKPSSSYQRELVSVIPQSTVGCITHAGIKTVWDLARKEKLPWYILSNKHDSFMVMCPASEARECAKVSSNAMKLTLTGRDGVQFQMKSEVQVGRNWGKYHPEKNPQGMKEIKV